MLGVRFQVHFLDCGLNEVWDPCLTHCKVPWEYGLSYKFCPKPCTPGCVCKQGFTKINGNDCQKELKNSHSSSINDYTMKTSNHMAPQQLTKSFGNKDDKSTVTVFVSVEATAVSHKEGEEEHGEGLYF